MPRKVITDPLGWIKKVMEHPDVPLDNIEIEDGLEIIRIGEAQRYGAMSDAELAEEMKVNQTRVVLEEAMKRLARPTPPPVAEPTRAEATALELPDGAHICTGPNLPEGGIPCLCIRGEDHDEALFEVRVGKEPKSQVSKTNQKE